MLNLLLKDSKDKETKELRAIARFYKDTKRGFATNDGYYAIPSKGNLLQSFIMVRYLSFVGMKNQQEIL